jgi:hypothetical protein
LESRAREGLSAAELPVAPLEERGHEVAEVAGEAQPERGLGVVIAATGLPCVAAASRFIP